VGVIIQKTAGGILCFHELKWFTGGLRLSSGHHDQHVTLPIIISGIPAYSLWRSLNISAFLRIRPINI